MCTSFDHADLYVKGEFDLTGYKVVVNCSTGKYHRKWGKNFDDPGKSVGILCYQLLSELLDMHVVEEKLVLDFEVNM